MRILGIVCDHTAIAYYRLIQPMTVLAGAGVHFNMVRFLPNHPTMSNIGLLYELVFQYDLVILQRCYDVYYAKLIRQACDLVGIPMVYETDDDYFHIPPDNHGYNVVNQPGIIDRYHEILEMADAVTVTNRELAAIVYPFNSNVHIFSNNVLYMGGGEHLSVKKDLHLERANEQGMMVIPEAHGSYNAPAFFERMIPEKDGFYTKKLGRIVRLGYSATPSHRSDVETIAGAVHKILDKYGDKILFITVGDKECHDKLTQGRKRCFNIEQDMNYWKYWENIRTFDIGLAPLQPNLFNMSKSQIKAVEYGSWGTVGLLPNMCTYTREFTHNTNCLLYNNQKEFYNALEILINDHKLRDQLSEAARDRVRDYRIEQSERNYRPRLEFYKSLVGKYKCNSHQYNKEVAV